MKTPAAVKHFLRTIGRVGGSSKSAAKVKASRRNLKKANAAKKNR